MARVAVVVINAESRMAAQALIVVSSVLCYAGRAAISAWNTVSVDKGKSILATDALVFVGVQTDFTCLVTACSFISAVGSHPLITTDTRSVGIVVCVRHTVLALVSARA